MKARQTPCSETRPGNDTVVKKDSETKKEGVWLRDRHLCARGQAQLRAVKNDAGGVGIIPDVLALGHRNAAKLARMDWRDATPSVAGTSEMGAESCEGCGRVAGGGN